MSDPTSTLRPATLVVINPSGNRTRLPVDQNPYTIGRHADNHLVLRDNRASRSHAQILISNGEYILEDQNSRHGTYLNGERITRHTLQNSDRIEFGFPDSYKLIFTLEEAEIHRILEQMAASPKVTTPGASNLAKLRSLVEVARALQSSLSTDDVLTAVVDAALAITSTERGFLLLLKGDTLEVRVARHRSGTPLAKSDLRVPARLIQRSLQKRRELLVMTFDSTEESSLASEMSVADLELRSVVCVPLVRVRARLAEETVMMSSVNDTVGVLYMDSRAAAADMSLGNRELLQTLALEASTILENARLLEEERQKQRVEEELQIAREIQMNLLPRSLPSTGWFRAAGSSIPSRQVGGDYYDVRALGPDRWSAVVADVSGKGVSSALLASLVQGAFVMAAEGFLEIEGMMSRINRFLLERTEGEKYATLFYCMLDRAGRLRYANAGHCAPMLLRASGGLERLGTTGMPVGMLEMATFGVEETQLQPGDKIVAFSDGLSEAENRSGEFFDSNGLRETIRAYAKASCAELHDALRDAVEKFTVGADQGDDLTILVVEYRPEPQ